MEFGTIYCRTWYPSTEGAQTRENPENLTHSNELLLIPPYRRNSSFSSIGWLSFRLAARENGKEKRKSEREGSAGRQAGRCDRQADDAWTSSPSTWPWLAGSSHPTLLPYLGFCAGRLLPNKVKYVSRNNVIRYCSLSTIQWHFYLFILRHFLCSDR